MNGAVLSIAKGLLNLVSTCQIIKLPYARAAESKVFARPPILLVFMLLLFYKIKF